MEPRLYKDKQGDYVLVYRLPAYKVFKGVAFKRDKATDSWHVLQDGTQVGTIKQKGFPMGANHVRPHYELRKADGTRLEFNTTLTECRTHALYRWARKEAGLVVEGRLPDPGH
jgi:hypothetical protein